MCSDYGQIGFKSQFNLKSNLLVLTVNTNFPDVKCLGSDWATLLTQLTRCHSNDIVVEALSVVACSV